MNKKIEELIELFRKTYYSVRIERYAGPNGHNWKNVCIYFKVNLAEETEEDYVDILFENDKPTKFEFGEFTTISKDACWVYLMKWFVGDDSEL